ncbi:MAG: hypothetical protein QF371_00940 [Flavobacteriales bacterium]|jgi:hypothetical protein|nr:hypothetical protein [Flavobacteriales bacterium]
MKYITVIVSFLLFSAHSFGQSASHENAELVIKYINDCSCKRAEIISGQYVREYANEWMDNIHIEDDFLVFEFSDRKHRWNIEKIIHVEVSGSKIEVYLQSWIRN